MTGISDTSPLNYLILTDFDHILPKLFGRVLVPGAVFDELGSAGAPESVTVWVSAPPEWLEVRRLPSLDPELAYLDPGEREAITLACQIGPALLLLDEAKGRKAAIECGLRVVGTLALLDRAAARGVIDLQDALDRLRRTSFRASPRLLEGRAGRRLGELTLAVLLNSQVTEQPRKGCLPRLPTRKRAEAGAIMTPTARPCDASSSRSSRSPRITVPAWGICAPRPTHASRAQR
jgi:predicted nucleic acid-binding protein